MSGVFPKEITFEEFENKDIGVLDLIKDDKVYKRASKMSEDFINSVLKERPKVVDRARKLLKELGLHGLWRGYYISLDRVITLILETEVKS